MDDRSSSDVAPSVEVPFLLEMSAMSEALRERNDVQLWDAARKSASQDRFFSELRNQVSLTSYQLGTAGRSQRQFCALVMLPMILPGAAASLVGNAKTFKGVFTKLRGWLSDWFEAGVDIRIFNAPTGYEEVAIWSPSVMREKLDQLTKWCKPTLALPPDFDFGLPDSAPRLAFVVAGVQQPAEYPCLPPLDAEKDALLQAKVRGLMEVHRPDHGTSQVAAHVPSFASDAILEGLTAWLQALSDSEGIGRWDATPVNHDAVILQMEIGEEGRLCRIPLRAHQIGLDGVDAVLKQMQGIGMGMGLHNRNDKAGGRRLN